MPTSSYLHRTYSPMGKTDSHVAARLGTTFWEMPRLPPYRRGLTARSPATRLHRSCRPHPAGLFPPRRFPPLFSFTCQYMHMRRNDSLRRRLLQKMTQGKKNPRRRVLRGFFLFISAGSDLPSCRCICLFPRLQRRPPAHSPCPPPDSRGFHRWRAGAAFPAQTR